jgi:hypothetical protein
MGGHAFAQQNAGEGFLKYRLKNEGDRLFLRSHARRNCLSREAPELFEPLEVGKQPLQPSKPVEPLEPLEPLELS